MNSQDILNGLIDDLKGVGIKMDSVLDASNSNGSVLTALLSKKDDMPPEIFDQLNVSLKEAREGNSKNC